MIFQATKTRLEVGLFFGWTIVSALILFLISGMMTLGAVLLLTGALAYGQNFISQLVVAWGVGIFWMLGQGRNEYVRVSKWLVLRRRTQAFLRYIVFMMIIQIAILVPLVLQGGEIAYQAWCSFFAAFFGLSIAGVFMSLTQSRWRRFCNVPKPRVMCEMMQQGGEKDANIEAEKK